MTVTEPDLVIIKNEIITILKTNAELWQEDNHEKGFNAIELGLPGENEFKGLMYQIWFVTNDANLEQDKNLCKTIGKDENTQRKITQMHSEIELSEISSGRLIHNGIHGRNKKYKLTISSEMIKKSFKDDLSLQDIV